MAKERVGYALGYGKFTNVREMADVMKQAEERGFEMAFFSETIELMRDSVSSLTAIGLATKKLANGHDPDRSLARAGGDGAVTGDHRRVNRRAADLGARRLHQEPCAGPRATHRVGATPSEVLKEYIESMRLLLTGEKVSYHGKFVNFDNVGLGWKPVRTKIPFYVPATATGRPEAGRRRSAMA